MGELVLFSVFAALAGICSIMVVVGRNPITCAMFLVGDLFAIACLYALLGADFLAAVQIIVYAGAILVLFTFVIMLLNLDPDSLKGPNLPLGEVGVLVLTVVGFGAIALKLFQSAPSHLIASTGAVATVREGVGNTELVGMSMFTTYIWPFELASILILLAVIASVVIAKKDKNKNAHTKSAATKKISSVPKGAKSLDAPVERKQLHGTH